MNVIDKFALYRRIYRMRKRKFKPTEIAASLDLPVGTVHKVLRQLEGGGEISAQALSGEETANAVYIVPIERRAYTILDMGGNLDYRQAKMLRQELQQVSDQNDARPVALRLKDARNADSSVIGLIVKFSEDMRKKDRKVMFLDPSKKVDALFKQLDIYKTIPVFGTEAALEKSIAEAIQKEEGRKGRSRIANF